MASKLGIVPTDFILHYQDNCGMNLSEIFNLWIAGGEQKGWVLGKFIINMYTKEHGHPPKSYEKEYEYAMTKENLIRNLTWAQITH